MGRGDKKTRKGKIFIKSFGIKRPKKKNMKKQNTAVTKK